MALKDKWIEKVDRVDIASAGDINLLAQAVIELEANAADVYTKTESDRLLSAKADNNSVYTKTESDEKLNLKADKASTLSGYGITDAYAKDEVDAKDNAIKNDIIEEQKENADSYVSSLNLFDYYSPYNVNGYINGKGSISSNATYKTSHFIKVEPNTTYYVLGFYKSSEYGYNFAPFLCEYAEDKTVVLFSTDVVNSFTTQSNTKYVRFSYRATSAYNRVGLSKVPFENSLAKPYNPMIIETKINKNSNMKRYYVSDYSDLGASSSLDVVSYATSIRKNERLIFSGDITTFNGIEIGLARDVDGTTYNRLEITSEKVIAYNYNGTSTEYIHGLTIENNIQIICEVGFSFNLNLTLVSNGESFTQTNIRWERKYECYPYAKSLSSVMTNCRLSWTCTDFNKDIWMFGDSYFGYTDKWTYYFNKYGYADNVLMDSYGGKGSKDAITSLKTYLKIAKPKIVVWCMGMNDGSDSDDAPSTPWLESVEELLNLSNIYDFKVVLSTIPSVPNINHEAKNAYVRSSNVYEKIDFARAVGATSDGTWYGDMLFSDNVHPSAKGALALFMRAVQDAPFLMISSN